MLLIIKLINFFAWVLCKNAILYQHEYTYTLLESESCCSHAHIQEESQNDTATMTVLALYSNPVNSLSLMMWITTCIQRPPTLANITGIELLNGKHTKYLTVVML